MKKYNIYRKTVAAGAWIYLAQHEATGAASAVKAMTAKHGGFIKAELVQQPLQKIFCTYE